MLLSPRYGESPILRIDVPMEDPAVPMLRQRRRLAALLATFDGAQWAADSRCAGWSAQDVAAHLVSTNQFWALSMRSALAGEPTRFLATFDPVASPAELVASRRSQSPADVLAQLAESTEALADVTDSLDEAQWSMLGEAPPGHVALRAVALHALWDSWIHERDIVLPQGLTPVEEPDEVVGCLSYVAALSPAFAASTNATRRGAIAISADDPDVRLLVSVSDVVTVSTNDPASAAPTDALHLSGPAVEIVEALSLRVPLACPVADDQRWLLNGLAQVFDVAR